MPAPVGPSGRTVDLYTASYALLVGVSRYDTPTAWASLDSIPAELTELKTTLLQLGFDHVEQVANPTGDELRQAVQGFIGRYGYVPGNRLLFFFSGHGMTIRDRGFFVPRDAPSPERDEAGFRRVAVSMDQVTTWARELTARHALFAFDSCFSGTIFRTRDRVVPQPISDLTAKSVRAFLSAGGAGEPVPARSVFTPTFTRALRGDADLNRDGFVTGTELGNWVQGRVIEYATRQTPQFGKLRDPEFDEGDIVFAVPGRGERAASGGAPPPTEASPQERQPSGAALDAARVAALATIARSEPANAQAAIQLGDAYYDAEKYSDAIGWYQEGLRRDPRHVNASTDLAVCYYYTSQIDRAVAQLDYSLSLDPRHTKALLNKGIVLAFGKKDVNSAVPLWRRVVELAPDSPEGQAAKRALDIMGQH